MNRLRERQILDEAIAAFNKTGAGKMWRRRVKPNEALEPDFYVELETGAEKLHYLAEVKPVLLKNTRMQFLLMKERFPRFLTVTKYVNPFLAEQMKEDGIQFIDIAGNAFIKDRNVFIYIKGNKPRIIMRKDLPPRAFRPAGVKLLFALLREPELLTETYRQIAENANVALGTVAWVIDDLRQLGYLVRRNEPGFTLVNREELLNEWATAYGQALRPKLTFGRYDGEPAWWEKAKIEPEKEQWGGEVAAAKLTGYLRPEIATIYTTRENLNEFLRKNRLKKDPAGNTEILERFWAKTIQKEPAETVPPILIYADLLATGDPRNIEAARTLYDRELHRFNRKN